MPIREIDIVVAAIRAKHSQVSVEQPPVWSADVNRAEIWLLRRPDAALEVQLESSSGGKPFVVEKNRIRSRVVVESIQEAVEVVELWLGLAGPMN